MDNMPSRLLAPATTGLPIPLLQTLQPQRILVFRALQVGDMLCAVPALRALRRALPHAHIALAGLPWAEQFVQRFPHLLDGFIAFPGDARLPEQPPLGPQAQARFRQQLEAGGFELVIQLHGSGQTSNAVVADFGLPAMAGFQPDADAPPNFLRWPSGSERQRLLALVEFLGAPAAGLELEFPLTAADRAELDASPFAQTLREQPYVCIHPGARWRDKCWPVQCFAQIADRMVDQFGLRVVLTGSAKEADLTQAVARHMRHPALDTASPLSLGAMAAIMHGARLLLSNDTGVSHIAAAFGLPSVVVFNQADMQRWAPLERERHLCLRDTDGSRVEEVWRAVCSLTRAGGAQAAPACAP